MTKREFDNLKDFPVQMVTHTRYDASHVTLKRGDEFTAMSKKQIGQDDFSVIDANGHPHYYEWCDLLYKS